MLKLILNCALEGGEGNKNNIQIALSASAGGPGGGSPPDGTHFFVLQI